jgi:hypothetical protein
MPFSVADPERLAVRMGTTNRSLRETSDELVVCYSCIGMGLSC